MQFWHLHSHRGKTCEEKMCASKSIKNIPPPLNLKLRCDGRIGDCLDGSDENDCLPDCTDEEFTCLDNKLCVPKGRQCDKVRDCQDGSDEDGCTYPCDATREFTCSSSGDCIDATRKCDYRPDCPDGSDELGCPPKPCNPSREFQCRTGQCVDLGRRCDSYQDCIDGSDEQGCSKCRQVFLFSLIAHRFPGKCLAAVLIILIYLTTG